MRAFDQRFQPVVTDPAVLEALIAAPAGTTATVRGIAFTKTDRRHWRNNFRAGMTSRQVASVLCEGDPYRIDVAVYA